MLTAREREILQLAARGYLLKDSLRSEIVEAAEGCANKEIAAVLHISLTTVETHRTHILQKLNLHSVPELILYAVRKAIIS